MSDPILLSDCGHYIEDQCVCDDVGEPKGQCICGAKWYEHNCSVVPAEDFESCQRIQRERGINPASPSPRE